MIQDTARFKMDLLVGLERVLHGKIKPSRCSIETSWTLTPDFCVRVFVVITQCCIRHLYTLSVPQSEKDPLILLAKSMERRRCNHHELDDPLSTLECLSSVIDPKKSATNKNRYVVASQETEVRRFCRGVRGVPLVYVKRSVMVLEPMAESTIGVKEGIEREKFRTGLRARLGKRKRDDDDGKGSEDEGREQIDDATEGGGGAEGQGAKRKKTRGPKGPNPLSVRKSKKEKDLAAERDTESTNVRVKEPNDHAEKTVGIIERHPDDTQVPSGKRRRKRKHKEGKLDKMRNVLAEDGESGS